MKKEEISEVSKKAKTASKEGSKKGREERRKINMKKNDGWFLNFHGILCTKCIILKEETCAKMGFLARQSKRSEIE